MSPQEGLPQERIARVHAERVRPITYGIQGHKGTSNICIDQNVYHIGNEASTLNPTWVKDSNIGRLITVVHLFDEVPHDLPKVQRLKPNKL